jgi:hypothetical protein
VEKNENERWNVWQGIDEVDSAVEWEAVCTWEVVSNESLRLARTSVDEEVIYTFGEV